MEHGTVRSLHRSLRNPILGVHARVGRDGEEREREREREDIYCNPPSMQTCKISWAALLPTAD